MSAEKKINTVMERDSRISVGGHRGLVGSGIFRGLERRGYTNLLMRTRAGLGLG
jgi:GDP-L-fucose synthase